MGETNKVGSEQRVGNLNDVRAPVMLFCAIGYLGVQMSALPHWIVLGVVAVSMVVFTLRRSPEGVRGALGCTPGQVLAAFGSAALLYGVMWFSMQMVTGQLLARGAIVGGTSLPWPLANLLQIRGAVEQLPVAVSGLLAGLFLAPAEELFWRGFVQTHLIARTGRAVGALLTTLLYAIFYGAAFHPLAALAALLCGLAFSILFLRTRSLVPGMLAHAVLLWAGLWLAPLY